MCCPISAWPEATPGGRGESELRDVGFPDPEGVCFPDPEYVAKHGQMIAATAIWKGERVHLNIDAPTGIVTVEPSAN